MNIKKTYSKETTLTAQKVCQLLNDGKVNDLPLNVKQTIGTLTQTTFSGISYITEINAITIDSNRVLIIASGNSTHYLYSVILTITNTTITAGVIVQLNSVNSHFIKSILISSITFGNVHYWLSNNINNNNRQFYNNVKLHNQYNYRARVE